MKRIGNYFLLIVLTLVGVFFVIVLNRKPEWLRRSEQIIEQKKKKDIVVKKDIKKAEKVVQEEERELLDKINRYHTLIEENNKKIKEAGDSVEKPEKIKDPNVAMHTIVDAVSKYRSRNGSTNSN